MNKKYNSLVIALSIVVGLVTEGYLIGKSLERFKKEDRFISVRGFSEKEVKANLAVWTIKTRITTNDLLTGTKKVEENKQKIVDFLLKNGINPSEIVQQNSNVIDKLAREYAQTEIGPYRYIIENSIQVRTENVDTVLLASRQTDKLLQAGVVLSGGGDYNSPVQYLFTGLNEIKPSMLVEATQNAKAAALEFAREGNVTLGKIKSANQGLFTIVDRDFSIMSPSAEGHAQNDRDIYKKVRVVVNIVFSVE